MVSHLLIIDSRVAGWRTLVESLDGETVWELVDPRSDGLDRLEQVAAKYRDLSSIQVVSHGSPGAFQLGSTDVDLALVDSHSASFALIGQALAADGDLVLYGCDVGQGADGLRFVSTLARLTGADVAASTNATGPAVKGGDGCLEHAIGTIESGSLIPAHALEALPDPLGSTPPSISPTGTWLRSNPNNLFTTNGAIQTTSQVDFWAIMPEVDGQYTISVGGPAIDARFRLYNNVGNQSVEVTGEQDIFGSGSTESLTVRLLGGFWYYVGVTNDHTRVPAGGTYTLNVQGPALSTPTITIGGTANTGSASGTINFGGDTDTFRVVAPAGATTLTVRVSPGAGLDTRPWLYGASGQFLQEFDDGVTGATDSLVNRPVTAGNTYFISLTAFGSTATGNYSVSVDFNPDGPTNRAPVLSNPLTDVTWQEGRSLSLQALRTTFSDPDGDRLTFSASLSDGSPLPSWLSFFADSGNSTVGGTFSGTPPVGSPDFSVRMRATDPGGLSASQNFTIFTPAAEVNPGGNGAVTGTNGKDTLNSRPFNETIDGLAGIDTVVYGGSLSNYQWQSSGSEITVNGFSSVDRGVDRLINVERLRFTDGSVAFDLNGNAGKVAKILGAVFGAGAVSNKNYVSIGLSFIDGGMSYTDLCAFAISATGATRPDDIVRLLFTNVVGFAPSAAEAAPFVSLLNTGMSVGELGVLAADTSLNAINIDLVGLSSSGLEF